MKRTITLASFRRLDRAEEALIRAMMPRTATADPAPLDTPRTPACPRRVWAAGRLVTRPGFTLAEVVR